MELYSRLSNPVLMIAVLLSLGRFSCLMLINYYVDIFMEVVSYLRTVFAFGFQPDLSVQTY